MSNKIALVILDGFGIGVPNGGNAIYMAETPRIDALLDHSPVTHLSASGLDVGLPEGQMGNSEVGHTRRSRTEDSMKIQPMPPLWTAQRQRGKRCM